MFRVKYKLEEAYQSPVSQKAIVPVEFQSMMAQRTRIGRQIDRPQIETPLA
jgi:hypothetical protein